HIAATGSETLRSFRAPASAYSTLRWSPLQSQPRRRRPAFALRYVLRIADSSSLTADKFHSLRKVVIGSRRASACWNAFAHGLQRNLIDVVAQDRVDIPGRSLHLDLELGGTLGRQLVPNCPQGS